MPFTRIGFPVGVLMSVMMQGCATLSLIFPGKRKIIIVLIEINMPRRLIWIVFLYLISPVVPGLVIAAPLFPAPPDANVEWVGRNMEVNGIRSDIRAFNTDDSIRKVINFYTKEWDEPVDKGLPGYIIE